MSPILEHKIRFAAAAGAVGTTPKTIRNWIQRGQVENPKGHESGWRNFSYVDLVVLTIVRILSEYGVSISDAFAIATIVVKKRLGPLVHFGNTPPEALLAGFTGTYLIVWKSGEGWKFRLVCGGVSLIEADEEPKTVVALPLDSEISDMYARLKELSDDGIEGEEAPPP